MIIFDGATVPAGYPGRVPTLLVPRGLPGCGKSTALAAWLAEDPEHRVVLGRDDWRTVLGCLPVGEEYQEAAITVVMTASVEALLRHGWDVGVDSTHIQPGTLEVWRGLAGRGGGPWEGLGRPGGAVGAGVGRGRGRRGRTATGVRAAYTARLSYHAGWRTIPSISHRATRRASFPNAEVVSSQRIGAVTARVTSASAVPVSQPGASDGAVTPSDSSHTTR